MLVTVTGFGSVWRRRIGKDPSDPRRFARAAYFNTTGVPVNGTVRNRRKIVGHVRLNGVGGFDPNYPLRMVNSVFECADPCIWQGQNKVLFERILPTPRQPDYFLVVARSSEVGHLDVGSPAWKSEGTLLISFSESRDQQEVMLLLPADAWLRGDLGRFALHPFGSCACASSLQLTLLPACEG